MAKVLGAIITVIASVIVVTILILICRHLVDKKKEAKK